MCLRKVRRFRLLVAAAFVAISLPAVLTTLCYLTVTREAHARGSDAFAQFLPPSKWGFGDGDTVQVALARPAGPDGQPQKAWDTRRRWGVIETIERRWIPAGASIPP